MQTIETSHEETLRWYAHFGLLGLLAAAWFLMAIRWGLFSGPTGLSGIGGVLIAYFWGTVWIIYALCSTGLLATRIDHPGATVWTHTRMLVGVACAGAALIVLFTSA